MSSGAIIHLVIHFQGFAHWCVFSDIRIAVRVQFQSLKDAYGKPRTLAEASRTRSTDLTSGDAVRAYLEELAKNTSTYQSLAALIGTVIQYGTPGCKAITAHGQRLLQRGQEAGAIRRDVTYEDFIYVVTAVSIAIDNDRSSTARIGHLVDMFLNGISVKGRD